MFSVGIFTSHFPYIVIVAFYAFILIFGGGKTAQTDTFIESNVKTEIQTENYYTESKADVSYYFENNLDLSKLLVFEKWSINGILKHTACYSAGYSKHCYCFSRFSRPPPVG